MKPRIAILASAMAIALFLTVEAYPQGRGGAPQGGAAPQGGGAQGGAARGGQGGQNGQNQNGQGGQNGQQAPGALAGTVVSSTTGEPLRKVNLTLQPQGRGGGSVAAASSDNSGAFRFNSVVPGTYTLSGERTGYVRGVYGEDRPGNPGTPITITTGQTQGGVQLKLLPQSVITGKVYDLDGDPVQGAQVQVMRYSYPRGQRQLSNVAQDSTNDLGEYRIANLAPGRYYVSAADRGVLTALLNGGGGRGGRGRGGIILGNNEVDPEAYVTTYYPRTVEIGGATPLELVPGSEARGIDIGLLKGRNYSITGFVEGVPAATPAPINNANTAQGQAKAKGKGKGGNFGGGANVIVNLSPRNNQQQFGRIDQLLGGTAQVNADGSFELKGVRPGSYWLQAQARGANNTRLSGRTPIEVTSGDLDRVRVRLSEPLEITGLVAPAKEDKALNLQQVRLNFTSQAGGGLGGGGRGGPGGGGRIDIDAAGKFTTKLDMDTYSIEMQGASGYYLKEVRMSGQVLENNVLDLNFAGAQLQVVLANDMGSITGTVEQSNGDPVASARVTVVPANNSPRRDLYKNVTSGSDGTFTVSDLPPGSYKVFAWEEVEQNAWMDPDYRRPFESQGTTAEIRDSAGPALKLKLIGRDQMAAVQ